MWYSSIGVSTLGKGNISRNSMSHNTYQIFHYFVIVMCDNGYTEGRVWPCCGDIECMYFMIYSYRIM